VCINTDIVAANELIVGLQYDFGKAGVGEGWLFLSTLRKHMYDKEWKKKSQVYLYMNMHT